MMLILWVSILIVLDVILEVLRCGWIGSIFSVSILIVLDVILEVFLRVYLICFQ